MLGNIRSDQIRSDRCSAEDVVGEDAIEKAGEEEEAAEVEPQLSYVRKFIAPPFLSSSLINHHLSPFVYRKNFFSLSFLSAAASHHITSRLSLFLSLSFSKLRSQFFFFFFS